MRSIAIGAFVIALVLSIAWAVNRPGWDSGVAVASAFAALIASFFLGRDGSSGGQRQQVATGSVGIQAGRDVSTGNIKRGK